MSADFRAFPQLRGTQQRGAARSVSSRTGRSCLLQQQRCALARLLCATWVLRKERQDRGERRGEGAGMCFSPTLQQQRRQSGRGKCARFLLYNLSNQWLEGWCQHILPPSAHGSSTCHTPPTPRNAFKVVITGQGPVQIICTVPTKIRIRIRISFISVRT